jgi:HD-GYP domain-containing protein (c-di-GMP phosphodiesterase class II)
MDRRMTIDRASLQALKLSEIRNSMTEFDLYLDLGGEIVPYANGPHCWSPDETEELLQNGQFVLLYNRADADRVRHYLASRVDGAEKPHTDASYVLADGISEFVKTLYAVRFPQEHYGLVKSLTLALDKFLQAYPQLSDLCLRLAQHDPYTFYHSARVAGYAVALGLALRGADEARLWDMAMGSFLHDLGNLSVPREILNHAGSLSDSEWNQVRQHPEEGLKLLEDIPLTRMVRDIIFYHHERLDGGGYPRRLRGSMISPELRIVSFADVYTALTVPRSYQKARSSAEAIQFIEDHLLKFLDPTVLHAMRSLLVVEGGQHSQIAG